MKKIFAVIAMLGLVAGCSSVTKQGNVNIRKAVGLSKNAPDPFLVIKNKPLEMPMDVAELPTPDANRLGPAQVDPIGDARMALLKTRAATGAHQTVIPASYRATSQRVADADAPQSPAETMLLANADTDADIRTLLDEEAKAEEPGSLLLDKWLGSLRKRLAAAKANDILDPLEELGVGQEAAAAEGIEETAAN